MPYSYNIGDWNKQFLADINAPNTPGNEQFLNAWENREGATGFNANPLATMEGGFGGTPGTHGIMSYPTIQQGAAATAAALENGRYNDVLTALRQGTANPSATYGSLGTWSGGGYTSLTGASTNPGSIALAAGNVANGPAITGLQQQQGLTNLNIANSSLLAQQNAAYAQQETGFQRQLEGLSEQGLGVQLGALGRAETLDPKLYGIQQSQFGLQQQGLGLNEQQIRQQRADITRQGKSNIASTISGQAGSGNLFTAGGRTQLSNVRADLASALKSNTIQDQQLALSNKNLALQEKQAGLTHAEQMAQLKDQEKNLEIQAQRYGISKEELQARLQNSLQNINEGNISTILGFQQEGLSNALQLAQLLGQGAPLSAVAGGVPSTAPSQYTNGYGY